MVDIKIRLQVIIQGITFGASLQEADCVIDDGEISEWGRVEPKPTNQELEAIPEQDVQDYLDGLAAAQEQKEADATKLLYELSESELQWWINTDKATRDNAINAATTDPGLRSLHKKEADAIAAIASILNLLRKGGLFDAYLP